VTITTARTDIAAGYEWDLDTLERGGGVAWAQRGPEHTRLRVADRPPPGEPARAGDLRWHSATEIWLSADGTVVVRSRCSPPALVVCPSGARLLPAQPGEETAQLRDGDVLLLCSAGVLDAAPTGLGQVLAWSPRRLAVHEPSALLEHVMSGVPQGAAAVVRCVASHPAQSTARPHEEDR
jgi:hypothetical protein